MSKPLTNEKFKDMMKHPDITKWNRVFKCFDCTKERVRIASPYFDNNAQIRAGR